MFITTVILFIYFIKKFRRKGKLPCDLCLSVISSFVPYWTWLLSFSFLLLQLRSQMKPQRLQSRGFANGTRWFSGEENTCVRSERLSCIYIINIQIDLEFVMRACDYLYCCLILCCLFTVHSAAELMFPNLVSKQAGFLILNTDLPWKQNGCLKSSSISLGLHWWLNIIIKGCEFLLWPFRLQR